MNLFKGVFNNFLKDKTFIISTHALQYLCFFDRIFYMKQGRIEWMGSYNDIIKQKFYGDFVDKKEKNNEKNEEKVGKNKDNSMSSEDEDFEYKNNLKIKKIEEKKEKVSLSTYITLIK